MSIKKVYEALEGLDGGKELVDIVKEELAAGVDASAELRLKSKTLKEKESEIERLTESIKEAQEKMDSAEKSASTGRGEVEKQLTTMQKQIQTLTEKLDTTEKEKTRIEQERTTAKLQAEFGNDLRGLFGQKFGDTVSKMLITEGNLKYDDLGKIIYENEKGVYGKDEALEILKSEYKDYIRPSDGGSGHFPGKRTGENKGVDFTDPKVSATSCFEAARK